MIAVRNAEHGLLINEICSKCSFRADENTGVYLVYENARHIGSCIYKLKDDQGMIVFADLNITADEAISELTLRTVTDYMMRHGAKKLTSYANFSKTVYKNVGFTVTEFEAYADLTNFTLSGCCGH